MYAFADRDWAGVTHFLAAAVLAIAAATLLFVSLGSGSSDPGTVPGGASAAAPPAAEIVVRKEVAARPFEVAGASFTVDADPRAGWAGAIRDRDARPGQRWVVATVEVVNRDRRGFNPGLLSYLARGPRGALYAPVEAGIVGPSGLGESTGLPVGAGAVERLVFSLPSGLRHPVLAIQPSPAQALEVRVRLG
jgi:hypothetical protein